MSDERRYSEDEIEEIFRRASEVRDEGASPGGAGPGGGGGAGGLTLPELQEIGEQVGFSRDVVARAAAGMQVEPPRGGKIRRAGLPVGVDRTVPLPRPLTDVEWERLVARLRDTFNARGEVEVMGRLRQWSNGNLRVSVEPTATGGHQLRLHTHKGSLRPLLSMSAAMILTALVLVTVSLTTGNAIDMMGPPILVMIGLGVGGTNLVALPGWASTRQRQMDEIAAMVSDWTALPPPQE